MRRDHRRSQPLRVADLLYYHHAATLPNEMPRACISAKSFRLLHLATAPVIYREYICGCRGCDIPRPMLRRTAGPKAYYLRRPMSEEQPSRKNRVCAIRLRLFLAWLLLAYRKFPRNGFRACVRRSIFLQPLAPLRPASRPLRGVPFVAGKMLRMPSPPALNTEMGEPFDDSPIRRAENMFWCILGALPPCGRRLSLPSMFARLLPFRRAISIAFPCALRPPDVRVR